MRASRIALYGCTSSPVISMDAAASFMQDTFGIRAEVRPPPAAGEQILDACRVRSLFLPPDRWGGADAPDISLYDGHMLAERLGGLLSHDEGTFHALLVDWMVGTYEHADMRYHGRALVSANPCIVSVRGICEAPARPREYCVDVMASGVTGEDLREIELRYADRFISQDDARLQDAAQGYLMQAVFHFETGEAFCENADCRLYNSHWQSDLVRTQVSSPRLCARHRDALRRMADS